MAFDMALFDTYRENNRLEVKKAEKGLPRSLWESYSAFANTSGGTILLGLTEKEDGSFAVSGVNEPEKLLKDFWNTVNSNKVSINLLRDRDVSIIEAGDGKNIISITVPAATREDKPVYIDNNLFGGSYRRNFEGDYHCTKNEVNAMLRDQVDNSDLQILDDQSIEDFDLDAVSSYHNEYENSHMDHPWKKLPREDFLKMIGAAGVSRNDGQLHPTVAGLLMFGKEYMIVRQFPSYFLDYREENGSASRWIDRVESSSGVWSGNVYDFYRKVSTKLTADLKVPFRLEGIQRIDNTPVHEAVREALANCLLNADWILPTGVVVIKKTDGFRFENPGSIRVGKPQMLAGGISDARNKTLMKMFNLIGIGERAGSGVQKIMSAWNEQGWKEPQISESYGPDRTVLELSFENNSLVIKSGDKKQAKKTSEKNKRIIEIQIEQVLKIVREGAITTNIVAENLGVSAPRAREILRVMCSKGYLEPQGSTKHRTYIRKND